MNIPRVFQSCDSPFVHLFPVQMIQNRPLTPNLSLRMDAAALLRSGGYVREESACKRRGRI